MPAAERRGGVILGIILIALGGFFLAERVVGFDLGHYGWPFFVIVPGVLLFAAALATADVRAGTGLATAGGITTMVGIVLAVQNVTGLWATWAYAWALVGPGGRGVGVFLDGLFRGQPDLVSAGARTIGVALALFAGFGLFFEESSACPASRSCSIHSWPRSRSSRRASSSSSSASFAAA